MAAASNAGPDPGCSKQRIRVIFIRNWNTLTSNFFDPVPVGGTWSRECLRGPGEDRYIRRMNKEYTAI